jgi:hypothetical protein
LVLGYGVGSQIGGVGGHFVVRDGFISEIMILSAIFSIYQRNLKFISERGMSIEYRLLPMNHSIISESFTREQAEAHDKLVKEHLYCPDGVRLMNRPAN